MVEDNWAELNAIKRENEEKAKAVRKKANKNRLFETGKKRMKTCFIGAVAAIEKHMPFLFEDESGREVFETVRKEILDNGNNQVRNFEKDLENYDVDFLQYRLELKMGDGQICQTKTRISQND